MASMDNSISDFASVKAFTFRKALLISPQVNHVTIGPQATINNDESNKMENLENEQNSCNIDTLKRLNNVSKQNMTLIQNDSIISIKKLVQEKEFERQNEVKKKIQHRVWQMEENDRAIQEKMDKLRLSMASDRERRTAEQLAYLLSEEEKIAEQEEINKKQEQELRIQHAQEQNERQMEAYRSSMKEKEEQEEMRRKQEQLQAQRAQEQKEQEEIKRKQEQQLQAQRIQAQKEQQEQREIQEKEKMEEVKRNQEQQKRQMEEFLKNMEKKEQEEIKRRQEQQLQDQRVQEQKKQQEQAMEELRKNMEEKNENKETNRNQEQQSYDEFIHKKEEQRTSIGKKELTEAIVTRFNDFMMHYQNIITICNACQDKQSFYILIEKHQPMMKDLLAGSVLIKQKINSEMLIDTDLNIMDDLLSQMEDLMIIIQTGIDDINVRHGTELVNAVQTENENQSIVNTVDSQFNNTESVQQLDEITVIENKENKKEHYSKGEMCQQVVVAPNIPDRAEVSTNYTDNKEEFTEDSYAQKESVYTPDKELLEIYFKSQKFLKDYEESYRDFLQLSNLKTFRFNCQKAINIPVNTISGISEGHLRDKYDKLHSLLMGKSDFSAGNYSDAVKFCKDHLAKKLINQGETLVSSKPEMAFPIAAVIVALWNEHPDFGELFLAHLYKTCCVMVPSFKLRKCSDTIENYRIYLGYKNLDNDMEEQDKFLKRMSGLMRLYASITVTKQRRGITKHHPHGLQYAWRWLAAILNLEPHADTSDLCATLIFDMLQVAGNMLWNIYPTQFPKLLKLLMEQYYTRMQQMKDIGSGPLLRLEVFLNNALQQNTIPSPHGMLPYNFW